MINISHSVIVSVIYIMDKEFIFRIIEIGLQIMLVIFAGMALFVWKREIRGKDKYKLAKDLLTYIKEIRFLIYEKSGSFHQIYLNDILVNKGKFYKEQLTSVGKEKIYFDQSIWRLFNHICIRSDLSLPKRVRLILNDLCPISGKIIDIDKNKHTYVKLGGFGASENKEVCSSGIYLMNNKEDLTIEMYFKKWEKLLIELQKLV